MTVPFMRAYTELLVRTCHRRGAHAMGGMAAFVPSRRDAEANAQARRSCGGQGAGGVRRLRRNLGRAPRLGAGATAEFDAVLGGRPNQVDRMRDDVSVGADELLDVRATPGSITEEGLRNDVNVGIQYISSWLRGNGAAGIYGLMEDAATAEIARSQVWQWVQHGAELEDGRDVTPELVRGLIAEELETIRDEVANDEWFYSQGRPAESRGLFEQVALADEFEEFLTLPAYEKLLELEKG